MKPSKIFRVPPELALLYDFVNSLDLRRYTQKVEQHGSQDELATPGQLGEWMRERGLLDTRRHVSVNAHRMAMKLRAAVRDYLQVAPEARAGQSALITQLNDLSSHFPLTLVVSCSGEVALEAAPGSSPLAKVLGEIHVLAVTSRLERLKMCPAEDCHWVFFDRSKPGSRRWCSSLICGNRHKTRSYRQRQREELQKEQS